MPDIQNPEERTVPRLNPGDVNFQFLTPRLSRSTAANVKNGYFLNFVWWNYPDNPNQAQAGFKAILNWAEENDVRLRVEQWEKYFINAEKMVKLPYAFKIHLDGRGYNPREILTQDACWDCGIELPFPTIQCPDCNAIQYCDYCQTFDSHVTNENGIVACDNCEYRCAECGGRIRDHCHDCHPMHDCIHCGYEYAENDMHFSDEENSWICQNCYQAYCPRCANIINDPDNFVEENGERICWPCAGRIRFEEFDDDAEMANTKLRIATIEGREAIRMCGLEIEGGTGDNFPVDRVGEWGGRNRPGDFLARSLYDSGLTIYDRMVGYHQGERGNLVHIEKDSSVDWEMVIGPINVANPDHIRILNNSVKVLRQHIKDGQLKLDMRAGLHVHVGAEKVALQNAYNLHKIYMHLEDFLYRLGAAKWEYHRSIPKDGKGTTAKSPNVSGKLNFARTFGNHKYYGLSFKNYFERYLEKCRCGASQYGVFEDCTCNLGKCTFEFRLFNTTANMTKIHAYLALCQALVAKAIEMPEIKDDAEYPPLDFIAKKFADLSEREKSKLKPAWEDCIRFVAEELPLTKEEKQSIFYCVMSSDVGKLVENASILLGQQEV